MSPRMIPKPKYLKSAACYSSFFHHNKAYSISVIVRFAQKLKLSLKYKDQIIEQKDKEIQSLQEIIQLLKAQLKQV